MMWTPSSSRSGILTPRCCGTSSATGWRATARCSSSSGQQRRLVLRAGSGARGGRIGRTSTSVHPGTHPHAGPAGGRAHVDPAAAVPGDTDEPSRDRTVVDVGTPADDLLSDLQGFHGPERDREDPARGTFRWTGPRASLTLPGGAGRHACRGRPPARPAPPRPRSRCGLGSGWSRERVLGETLTDDPAGPAGDWRPGPNRPHDSVDGISTHDPSACRQTRVISASACIAWRSNCPPSGPRPDRRPMATPSGPRVSRRICSTAARSSAHRRSRRRRARARGQRRKNLCL